MRACLRARRQLHASLLSRLSLHRAVAAVVALPPRGGRERACMSVLPCMRGLNGASNAYVRWPAWLHPP